MYMSIVCEYRPLGKGFKEHLSILQRLPAMTELKILDHDT
jgi:hypothetical protein